MYRLRRTKQLRTSFIMFVYISRSSDLFIFNSFALGSRHRQIWFPLLKRLIRQILLPLLKRLDIATVSATPDSCTRNADTATCDQTGVRRAVPRPRHIPFTSLPFFFGEDAIFRRNAFRMLAELPIDLSSLFESTCHVSDILTSNSMSPSISLP